MKKAMIILFLLFISMTIKADELNPELFPVDPVVRKRVNFWKKIYTITDSEQGYIHDEHDLGIVYELVNIKGMNGKKQRAHIKERKNKIKNILLSIAKKNKENLTDEEWQINLLLLEKTPEEIKEMADSLRWQRGMSDRFRHGLAESYMYLEHIKKIFKEEGVPEQIAFLPHVESSFNYKAYSKVGAAGIWQFMRTTAKVFRLKVNYTVDERLDPLIAGRAAARLLKSNFEKLGAWPLAITAYNHGPQGMERAARTVGTTIMGEIIDLYSGGRFGFASKNFYACFVASYELANDYEKYFGDVLRKDLLKFSEIELDRPLKIQKVLKIAGVDLETFKFFNKALRPKAFEAKGVLPKGLKINLPELDVVSLSGIKDKLLGENEEIEENIAGADEPSRSPASIDHNVITKQDIARSYNFDFYKASEENHGFYVEVNEGISQYAEWADIKEEKLREINNIDKNAWPIVGKEFLLPLMDEKELDEFKKKRIDYHTALEEDFYSNYKITGVEKYKVKKNQDLVDISDARQVPLWLLRKFLPRESDLSVKEGQIIDLPSIEALENGNESVLEEVES